MHDFLVSFTVFLIGFAAGFADSVVAIGGLLSIPLLIFIGLAPHVAIATDRFCLVGQTLAAMFRFQQSKKIRWEYIPIFSVLALVGGFIGANILLQFEPRSLERIIGFVLLAVLPLLFLKQHIGIQRGNVTSSKRLIGFLLYFAIMMYNGFFGAGAGPLTIYVSMMLFGFTIVEYNATATIPWFLLSIVSLAVFAQHNIVDYRSGIFLLIGMTMGGYVGAHTLIKIGNIWAKRVFTVVVIVFAIKLLFF